MIVETEQPLDWRSLDGLEFVRDTHQIDLCQMRVVVDDAGTAAPALVEALSHRNVTVVSTREDQPTFDEVFATLVRRDEEARAVEAESAKPAAAA